MLQTNMFWPCCWIQRWGAGIEALALIFSWKVESNFKNIWLCFWLKELAQLKKEMGRLSVGHTRAEERVLDEARLRVDIEHRNKVLEEEMTKVRYKFIHFCFCFQLQLFVLYKYKDADPHWFFRKLPENQPIFPYSDEEKLKISLIMETLSL